ncbi:unnamed protein product [Closterium sp. NIES-54]
MPADGAALLRREFLATYLPHSPLPPTACAAHAAPAPVCAMHILRHRGGSNSKFFNFIAKHILPAFDKVAEDRRGELLRSMAEASPFTSPADSRHLLPGVTDLLKDYMAKKGADVDVTALEALLFTFNQLAHKTPNATNALCGYKIVTGQPSDRLGEDFKDLHADWLARVAGMEEEVKKRIKAVLQEVAEVSKQQRSAKDEPTITDLKEKKAAAARTLKALQNMEKLSKPLKSSVPQFLGGKAAPALSWKPEAAAPAGPSAAKPGPAQAVGAKRGAGPANGRGGAAAAPQQKKVRQDGGAGGGGGGKLIGRAVQGIQGGGGQVGRGGGGGRCHVVALQQTRRQFSVTVHSVDVEHSHWPNVVMRFVRRQMGGRLVAAALRRELPFPFSDFPVSRQRAAGQRVRALLVVLRKLRPHAPIQLQVRLPPALARALPARVPRASPVSPMHPRAIAPPQIAVNLDHAHPARCCHYLRYQTNTGVLASARYPRSGRPSFLNMIKGKTIAVIGDSLTAANFVPSLLCQISEVTTVKNGSRRTLSGGSGAQYMPPMVAFYYDIPAFGARIVSIWDDYLMRTSTDKGMIAKLATGFTPGPDDAIIDVETVNPQWGDVVGEWHAVLLETTSHWRVVPDAPRLIFTNDDWQTLNGVDPYMAHARALKTIANFFEARRQAGKAFPVPFFMTAPPQHSAKKIGGSGVCGSPGRVLNENEIDKMLRTNVQLSRYWPMQRAAFPEGSAVRRFDITLVSAYRPEAHCGIYSKKNNPVKYLDCLHWCQPGVPDIWADLFHEMLLAEPLFSGTSNPTAASSKPTSKPKPKPKPKPTPKKPKPAPSPSKPKASPSPSKPKPSPSPSPTKSPPPPPPPASPPPYVPLDPTKPNRFKRKPGT